jgi:signal peptide peptidase SppA
VAWFSRTAVIPVVSLAGAIMARTRGGPGLSAAGVEPALEAAFKLKAPAVALEINSPGGSPVQSHLIHDRVRVLAKRHNRPVLAFTTDVAASGGYILALAGDEIIAAPDSLVGSIGVISGGFGFVDAIARLGIERRVYTAGTNKAFLDPFLPEQPDNLERLKEIQTAVHARFVELVRSRRGSRLAADDRLFTGQVFAGSEAVALGLVDATGSLRDTLEQRYGEKIRLKRFGIARKRWPLGLLGGSAPASPPAGLLADWSEQLLDTLEERALWARFGL